nr:MAG TPA: hypothetical protein [Caudoviricetes sp.]
MQPIHHLYCSKKHQSNKILFFKNQSNIRIFIVFI